MGCFEQYLLISLNVLKIMQLSEFRVFSLSQPLTLPPGTTVCVRRLLYHEENEEDDPVGRIDTDYLQGITLTRTIALHYGSKFCYIRLLCWQKKASQKMKLLLFFVSLQL